MTLSGPASDSDDDPEIYNVECVIAESWDDVRKKPLYLIKWEDYDLYDATWETQSSFEEGAEDVLRDWQEVKRQRLDGEIPEFDIEDFEIKRARKLSGEDLDGTSVSKAVKERDLAGSEQKWVHENSSDSSSQSEESETSKIPAAHVQSSRSSSNVESTHSGRLNRPQTSPTLSELLPLRAQSRNKGALKHKPRPLNISHIKKDAIEDDDLYKVPETRYTYDKLKHTLKRKYKIEATVPDVKNEQNPTDLGDNFKESKTLPAGDDFRVQRERRLNSHSDTKPDRNLSQSTSQLDGLLHVADAISKDPHALYDLIVKTREQRWRISISEAVFGVLTTLASTRSESIQCDYETLRDKAIISLHNADVPLLKIAERERYENREHCRRFVVIDSTNKNWSDVPEGLEIHTLQTFRL